MQDKARTYTDKELAKTERQISRMYQKHSALIQVRKEYEAYMNTVYAKTKKAYYEFVNETDTDKKKELKKIYKKQLKDLTMNSKQYQSIIKKFTSVMVKVNQEALDVVNNKMTDVYVENYNQVAEDCKKAGIKVNG